MERKIGSSEYPNDHPALWMGSNLYFPDLLFSHGCPSSCGTSMPYAKCAASLLNSGAWRHSRWAAGQCANCAKRPPGGPGCGAGGSRLPARRAGRSGWRGKVHAALLARVGFRIERLLAQHVASTDALSIQRFPSPDPLLAELPGATQPLFLARISPLALAGYRTICESVRRTPRHGRAFPV